MKDHHFKDDNGKEITPIGPTAWGGDDRTKFYNDLVWTGQSDEKFLNKGKKIVHESQLIIHQKSEICQRINAKRTHDERILHNGREQSERRTC